MKHQFLLIISLAFLISACKNPVEKTDADLKVTDSLSIQQIEVAEGEVELDTISALGESLLERGLQRLRALDSSIVVDVKYATEDNFMGRNLYGDFDDVYLQDTVSKMLIHAHEILKTKHPDLRFLLFDGVRPRSVQSEMWDMVEGTEQQEYVASPKSGSMHNYGAAIDLSLVHVDTGELDMGTPFDFFGLEAHPRHEDKYLKEGVLSQTQVDNRRILRRTMNEAGFTGILNEWWHFNAFGRDETRKRFEIVE